VEEEAPVIVEKKVCYAKARRGAEVVDTDVEIPCQD
jgi:hypothetical protein